MRTSRLVVRSSDLGCLVSGFCSSGRGFAPRFLQTSPRGDALALRSHFTSIRLCRGLAPPGCRTCSAHDQAGRPAAAASEPNRKRRLGARIVAPPRRMSLTHINASSIVSDLQDQAAAGFCKRPSGFLMQPQRSPWCPNQASGNDGEDRGSSSHRRERKEPPMPMPSHAPPTIEERHGCSPGPGPDRRPGLAGGFSGRRSRGEAEDRGCRRPALDPEQRVAGALHAGEAERPGAQWSRDDRGGRRPCAQKWREADAGPGDSRHLPYAQDI